MILTEDQAINVSLRPNPARRKRWGAITEAIEKELEGRIPTTSRNVEMYRTLVEAMCDNQLLSMRAAEGIGETLPRELVEQAYSSHRKWLTEAYGGEGTAMGWDTGSPPSTAKVFTTQSLGMVRRVFPRLLVPMLFSVQPMSQPTGKVFYRDILYGHSEGTIAAGDRVDRGDDGDQWDIADLVNYASEDTSGNPADVEGSQARELKLNITSTDVTARSRKIGLEWSVEAQQDLQVYHGMNVADDLMMEAGDEMSREIDRDVLEFAKTEIAANGAGTVNWDKGGYTGDLPSEQRAWDEKLYDAIEDAATYVVRRRYRYPSWILTGPEGAARLRKLNGFVAIPGANLDLSVGTGSRTAFGTINNRWQIYVDPWMEDDLMILGYKGSSFFEAGIVYCPYVPFYRTPQFDTPMTFLHQRGIMSRYAKVSVVPKMYSRVVLFNSQS